MFLGINMFLTLLRAHFNPRYARAKMILSRAKNIFMPANVNSIVILDADDVEHDKCVVARLHALTSFIKECENKTTTKWLACSRFASFDEDNIAVLMSEKDSKRTKGAFPKSIPATRTPLDHKGDIFIT